MTKDQKKRARDLYRTNKLTFQELARMFNVSRDEIIKGILEVV